MAIFSSQTSFWTVHSFFKRQPSPLHMKISLASKHLTALFSLSFSNAFRMSAILLQSFSCVHSKQIKCYFFNPSQPKLCHDHTHIICLKGVIPQTTRQTDRKADRKVIQTKMEGDRGRGLHEGLEGGGANIDGKQLL